MCIESCRSFHFVYIHSIVDSQHFGWLLSTLCIYMFSISVSEIWSYTNISSEHLLLITTESFVSFLNRIILRRNRSRKGLSTKWVQLKIDQLIWFESVLELLLLLLFIVLWVAVCVRACVRAGSFGLFLKCRMPYTKSSWCFQLEHYMKKLLHINSIISHFVMLMQKRIHLVICIFRQIVKQNELLSVRHGNQKWIGIWIHKPLDKKMVPIFVINFSKIHIT